MRVKSDWAGRLAQGRGCAVRRYRVVRPRARSTRVRRRFPPEPMAVRTHDDVPLVRRGAGRQVVFSSRTTFSEEPVQLFADLLVRTAEGVRALSVREEAVAVACVVEGEEDAVCAAESDFGQSCRHGVDLLVVRESDCFHVEDACGLDASDGLVRIDGAGPLSPGATPSRRSRGLRVALRAGNKVPWVDAQGVVTHGGSVAVQTSVAGPPIALPNERRSRRGWAPRDCCVGTTTAVLARQMMHVGVEHGT